MADPHVVSALKEKRAEIERSIAHYHQKIKEARADLVHVVQTLRLFETPDEKRRFPAHGNLARLFGWRELPNLCRQALEEAGEPMTSREMAIAVIRMRGWDEHDTVLQSRVAFRIASTIGRAAKRGKQFTSPGLRNGVRVWALPDAPES